MANWYPDIARLYRGHSLRGNQVPGKTAYLPKKLLKVSCRSFSFSYWNTARGGALPCLFDRWVSTSDTLVYYAFSLFPSLKWQMVLHWQFPQIMRSKLTAIAFSFKERHTHSVMCANFELVFGHHKHLTFFW